MAEIRHGSGAPDAPRDRVRASLPQQAASRLRDMILEQELVPGQPIREQAVAALLAISRTPLREALRMLAAEGLVELLPNRGAVVADPHPQAVQGMLQVMSVLEGLAGELACVQVRDEEISEIEALHFEMRAAFSRRDRLGYFKLNQRIHAAIVRSSRNETLTAYHRQLNARLYRVRYLSNEQDRSWFASVGEHEQILAALKARDGDALGCILREHLTGAWTKVRTILPGAAAAECEADGTAAAAD